MVLLVSFPKFYYVVEIQTIERAEILWVKLITKISQKFCLLYNKQEPIVKIIKTLSGKN